MEQINKSHGRIESIKGRLIKDTSFLYENLELDSFYVSIARIGIIEKQTVQTDRDDKSGNVGDRKSGKDQARALEYRDAALAVRCAIKGRSENRAERRSHDKQRCVKKILHDDEEI